MGSNLQPEVPSKEKIISCHYLFMLLSQPEGCISLPDTLCSPLVKWRPIDWYHFQPDPSRWPVHNKIGYFLYPCMWHVHMCALLGESEMKGEEENKVSAENIIDSQTFLIYKQRSFCKVLHILWWAFLSLCGTNWSLLCGHSFPTQGGIISSLERDKFKPRVG